MSVSPAFSFRASMANGRNHEWRSRITRYGEEDPDQLLAHPLNWRLHGKDQQSALSGVLESVGVVQNVIVNERTGHVVDGHLRITLAMRSGQPTIPVTYVDLDESEEALILATLDPIAALAGQDDANLAELLAMVETDNADVQALLESLAGETTITAGLTDPDDVPAVPDEPVTKPGDLWLLDRHRLLCGDSTVATDVSRLLGGVVPALTVTDPPYGVEYDPEWRHEAAAKGLIGFGAKRNGKVENDDRVDWSEAFSLVPSDVVYCWHAGRHASEVQRSLETAGYEIRSQIIWAKDSFSISRGHYHWQHEPCWYAVRSGATASWIGDRSQSTLWRINKNDGMDTGGHGTQKPIECMSNPIRNHEGDIYDPFVGSGTTIIAAEQLGRTCYVMDISPAYVDVSVRRWEAFTGQTATLAVEAMAGAA